MSNQTLPVPVLSKVKVTSVGWASASGRTGSEKDLAIDELAASLAASGQIDPIIVITLPKTVDGCAYEGVDGYRRCLAFARLGIEKVDALIYPTTCAGRAEEIRAAAIVQSLPHSDVEKALMVGALVDDELAKVGNNLATATENVAGRLNKPARFVSDYRYLTRLTRSARALLVERRLTLAQARELACISDPELQDEIADEAASNQDGGFGRDLGWVQRRCRDARRNLKVIAWDASVKFAGKPACTTCPSNTANDGMLYEHDRPQAKFLGEMAEERSGLGLCVNPKCFQHKADAAEQAREAIAKKAKTEMKKLAGTGYSNDPGEAARRVVERERIGGGLAAGLKDSIAMRSAKEGAEQAAPEAKKEDRAAGSESQPTAEKKASKLDSVRTVEQKAQEKFEEAKSHWRSQSRRAIFESLDLRPGGPLLFALMIDCGELDGLRAGYRGDDVEKKMAVKITSPSSVKAVEPLTRLATLNEVDLASTKSGEVLGMLNDRDGQGRVQHWFDEAHGFVDDAADCVVVFILRAIDREAGDKAAAAEPKLETFLAEAGVGDAQKPAEADGESKAPAKGNGKGKGTKAKASELEPVGAAGAAGVGGAA